MAGTYGDKGQEMMLIEGAATRVRPGLKDGSSGNLTNSSEEHKMKGLKSIEEWGKCLRTLSLIMKKAAETRNHSPEGPEV